MTIQAGYYVGSNEGTGDYIGDFIPIGHPFIITITDPNAGGPITPPDPHHIITDPADKIPDNIADLLADEEVTRVTVTLTEPDTATSDIFQAAKDNRKTISFDVIDEDDNTLYQWTFPCYGINNPDMDLDLSIKFASEKQDEIQAITGQQRLLLFSFAHHGPLPGPATLKIYVGNIYADGEIIFLYYYNEEAGTIELRGNGITVKDGYAEFTISHCSEYFFTDTEIPAGNNPATGDSFPILLMVALLLSSAMTLTAILAITAGKYKAAR